MINVIRFRDFRQLNAIAAKITLKQNHLIMATLLNPASSKYLLNPAPGFLHNEVTAWLSELAFVETEIQFLSKLLNSAFLRATSKEKIIELSDLDKKVKDFKTKNLDTLKQALANHEHELSLLDLDTF